jgi:methionine-rich copper-binding protein CopC
MVTLWFFVGCGLWMGTTAAQGHNQVAQTVPAADEVVTVSPLAVTITTVESLLQTPQSHAGFAITLTDDAGRFYGDGCVTVEQSTLSASFALGESGVYQVTYQLISADGHTVSDRYSFSFDAPANHVPAQALATAPVCGEEGPVSDSESAETPADSGSEPSAPEPLISPAPPQVSEASGPTLITAVAGAAVAVVALGTLWRIARRRNSAS